MRGVNAGVPDPDRRGDRSLLEGENRENEAGDPGDLKNVCLPDPLYGARTGFCRLQ